MKERELVGYLKRPDGKNEYGFLTVIYKNSNGQKLTHILSEDRKTIKSFVLFEKYSTKTLPNLVLLPVTRKKIGDESFFVFKNKDEIMYGSFSQTEFAEKMHQVTTEMPFRYHTLRGEIKKLLPQKTTA